MQSPELGWEEQHKKIQIPGAEVSYLTSLLSCWSRKTPEIWKNTSNSTAISGSPKQMLRPYFWGCHHKPWSRSRETKLELSWKCSTWRWKVPSIVLLSYGSDTQQHKPARQDESMVQQESVTDDSDTHSRRRFISTTKCVVGEITNSSFHTTTATALRHEYNVPFTMMYLIQVLNRRNPA